MIRVSDLDTMIIGIDPLDKERMGYTMGVCKKIKRKDDQERNVWENISEKKEGRVLERTRQSMKRKISNDL